MVSLAQTPGSHSSCILIMGDQLFPLKELLVFGDCRQVFMAESWDLCTHFRYHKQKILLFFASMRHYRDSLIEAGFIVHYHGLEESHRELSFLDHLSRFIETHALKKISHFQIADRFFEQKLTTQLHTLDVTREEHNSPGFLTPQPTFQKYLQTHRQVKMQSFYQEQRLRLKVMLDGDKPTGGRWSFDTENRKKLPAAVVPPRLPLPSSSDHITTLKPWIEKIFADHPGDLETFIWPVTRAAALEWLDIFLKQRLALFGPYEDAMSTRSDLVFHSGLSPLLNLGLLTPREVLTRVLEYSDRHEIELASLEGFIRQLIGWREFIYGIDRNFGTTQESRNFFGHERRLTSSWYEARTNIPPLDQAIQKAHRLGYVHHIERLMVLSNMMLLCEIHPSDVYRWFMEMFVDSADWVMTPNVFGMGQFSDGGIFASKPYIAGSNYLLKMSDTSKGPWCEVVDGLYWRFIQRHRSFFSSQPRMSMMVHLLDKLPAERLKRITGLAEEFLAKNTSLD